MKVLPSGSSEALAVRAGKPSERRKIATPASSARIVTAATTAVREKTRSPRRRRPPDAAASSWPALVVVSTEATNYLAGFDRFHSRGDFLRQRRGERRGAGLFSGQFLAFGADDVFGVGLDAFGFLSRAVFRAGDQVGDQHDRVGALRFRLAIEFEGDRVLRRAHFLV